MTYYNYLGQAMVQSAPGQSSIDGSPAGDETLQASAGSSSISGGGGGDLLIGSSGDTTFYIKDSHDRVQESPGGGVDTQIAYTSVILAPNVENLTVHFDFNFAVGNELNNLIIVDGSQWINGLAGDDVLVGSVTQRTTFQVRIGDGNDVIYNWNGNSQLQLLNAAGFETAADVRAQMTQSGADSILRLSQTETLTFRDMTPAAFTDRQLLGALDTTKLGAMTFSDEFDTLQIRDPSLGVGQWNTNFGGNLKDQYAYALVQNGEQQSYVAPGFQGRGDHDIGVNPFTIENGVLTITAAPVAADDVYAAWGATHTSGMLNTLGSFAQKYGYFEMRAEVPTAVGSWPAFWMIPSPYKPNAEADIMEGLAATPNVDYRRAYGGVDGSETQYDNVLTVDPEGFHTYGMLWTPQTVTFFYDGLTVLHGATPSTWTSPMSLIVNLAVGGWGGAPDPAAFPAKLNVDYVRAYALSDGSTEVLNLTTPLPVATLQDNGPASGQVNKPVTFEADGAAVTTSHIQLSLSPPTTLPPGQTMMIWEDAGAVFGAVSDGSNLAMPTALMAGSISQFTGAGTWLTSGKVVFAYLQSSSDGGQHLWDIVFDPVRKTFVRQDLGAASATPDATFIATGHGGFAVSWHTPDGMVVARGYDEYAYGGDVPGWYGPARQVTGDLVGVTADGQIIASNGAGQELYTLADASTYTPSTVSIQSAPVTQLEDDTGVTAFTYTVMRSGDTSAAGDVSWSVSGAGANPALGADFQGGVLPTGLLRFSAGELSKTLTVNVAGDATVESDERFVVTISNPTGAGVELRNATASGVIQNDDTGAGPAEPGGAGQVLTASGTGATLSGGAGDDTIYASQGDDVLTGGSGADQFVFGNEPWSPIRITDFTVGSDKLDLSALMQKAGYTGSDPIADRYVTLLDDGAGGTRLLFDRDGEGTSPQWGNYVIQLDKVSSSGLTWSGLTQGAGSPPPPSGGGTLVVFAGQSNMGVYGTDASNISSLWSQSPLTQIWNQTTQTFEELRPGVNTGYAGAPNGWGPEVAFAIDMRAVHPGETLYIVKSVAGGTQLAQDTGLYHADWSPMSSGELFDQTTQMISQASAAAGGLRPAAVFFGQGEEDANYQATAQAYGGNLTAFFSAVRADWLQDPNGKIGFFAIGTSPLYAADVRAGQLSVDQADANALSFDAAGLPLQADGLHLAAEGVNTSGDNFFQIFQSWADGSTGPGGDVFISAGPGSTLAGGAGDDTLIGGRGDEVLTGGAGADVFSFPAEPWSPNRITDFTVGVDRLDLSALFQKAGYAGADPVADHYITLLDDGAGGAQVLFDRDGAGPSPQWANYILKLDQVSAAGLTWSALTGGGATNPPPAQSPQLAFSSSAVSINEGDNGSTALVFNLSRTGDLSGTASASWSISGSGSAPAMASDFQGAALPAGSVAFAAGEASKSIVVQVAGDATAEPDERFTVTLSNATGATLGVKTASGTILDDDSAPAPDTTVRTSAAAYTLSGSDHNLELVGSVAQSGTGSGLDNTLISNDYGSSLNGLDGADTLVAGHGADILSGGAGADVFAFRVLPWNAGHVTDFVVGTDRLDLNALLSASGYVGSDPVGDGYLNLSSDGAGGVRIAFDTDGPGAANPWPTTITTLNGVASTGLTYAQLTSSSATPPPPPPPPPPPGGDETAGRVLTSSKYGDVLAGGAGADTLNAGQGPDVLTGAGGPDIFVFANAPWNAGHITDFTPGVDVIDLSQLAAATAYSGGDPLADRWLELRADGSGGTQVYVDLDGPSGSQWPTLVTTLDHVRPALISAQDWVIH
ncbi:type I secretion C-terminal target domain-containing protein [Phenylobacterium sp.]|uniref:type I secretion C-terminal target domain-containing protein n=1 Tax=Phenylobacterium sp. TaxID=1871053 RepID=UPI00286E0A8E|nr:type I secretion C-terminal target domain-containing protein [Phenylobacterium sp.]